MTTELKEKVAVTTGGTRGIGFEIARGLLAEGAKVFICGRHLASLKDALAGLHRSSSDRVDGMVADGRRRMSGIMRLRTFVPSGGVCQAFLPQASFPRFWIHRRNFLSSWS